MAAERHVAGTVEQVRSFARHALRAQREEHLAISRELQDLLAAAVRASAVRDPEVAVLVDPEPVRPDEELFPPRAEELPRRIELENGRLRSPHGDDDALAVDIDAGDFAPLLPGGQRPPAFHQPVRVCSRKSRGGGGDRHRHAAQPAEERPSLSQNVNSAPMRATRGGRIALMAPYVELDT